MLTMTLEAHTMRPILRLLRPHPGPGRLSPLRCPGGRRGANRDTALRPALTPRLTTALALLLILVPPRGLEAQAPDPTSLSGFRDAFVAAVADWNVDAWAELVTEDVVMMAPNGRVVEGRQAFRELWSRTFEGRSGVNPLEVEIQGFTVSGDLAVVRADYGPRDRDPVGQYVWKLIREEGGEWRLAWWIFNRRSGDGG